jgi:hypothetical protein
MKTLRTVQTMAVLALLALAACGGGSNEVKVSDNQWDKVDLHMTKQEVRRILPAPERKGSTRFQQRYKDCWFYSTSTKVNRFVCFVGGEVVIKGNELPTG